MTTAARGSSLLLIDSDPDTVMVLRALLRTRGDVPDTLATAPSLRDALAAGGVDADAVVIIGIDAGASTPAQAAAIVTEAATLGSAPAVALLTGPRNPAFESALLAAGAADFCWKEELSAPLLESQIRHARAHGRMRAKVREREALERKYYEAQKMETVRRLAGGIAHDFNNILTAIVGFGTLLQEQVTGNVPLERNAREILAASERASGLTRQLLAFGRSHVAELTRVPGTAVLDGLLALARRIAGPGIQVESQVASHLPDIDVDPAQLEAALLHLVVNARDAMPSGGRVSIAADADASHLRISVSDTGAGILPELQPHVFEPFVTTKERGTGAGLGLATVYSTITQVGGQVRLDSTPGEGTTVSVLLPVASQDPAPAAAAPLAAVDAQGRTILLVEDAAIVRQLAREVIDRAGYQVLEAADAEQALRLAAAHAGRIDLLLTDVVMPGRSGVELAARLRTERKDVQVLYMSGFTDNAIVSRGAGQAAFLQKPFTPGALLQKVREVLEPAD